MIPSYQPGLLSFPNEGARCLEVTINTPASGIFEEDLFQEMASNEIAFIQSVFIDNHDNGSAFQITFPGINRGYTINVQPYHQGWYPVSIPVGKLSFRSVDVPGSSRTIIFANVCMPYFDWGPISGVLVVPALIPLSVSNTFVGDATQTIIPAVAGKTIQVYRLQITFDNSCTVRFKTSSGAYLSGPITMFAGGSITWQASGVPWISGALNDGIQIELTNTGGATVVVGGLEGFTQN